MNRNNEFESLKKELYAPSIRLDYTVQRAVAKRDKKRKNIRRILTPTATVATVFAVFVLLVNISPAFASTVSRIPVVRELAQAVSFSKSLTAAVENDYVQQIDQTQTNNGITAHIKYAIVDMTQVNIFYTLDSEQYNSMRIQGTIKSVDEKTPINLTMFSTNGSEENGELQSFTADFTRCKVPSDFIISMNIINTDYKESEPIEESVECSDDDFLFSDEEPQDEQLAHFEFKVSIDPYFTSKCESLNLNRVFTLDDQIINLDTVEIYPTQMRLNFSDIEENTAWLDGMKMYVENENGERFETHRGLISYTNKGSNMVNTFVLESSFFSKSEHLTLYITDVKWLEKEHEFIHLDLDSKKADWLPEGTTIERAEQKNGGWVLSTQYISNDKFASGRIFNSEYHDADGNTYFVDRGMNGTNEDGEVYKTKNKFALKDYTDTEVWLGLYFSKATHFDTPVSVKIK